MSSSQPVRRVFICGTSRDLQAEREVLHAQVLPSIQERFKDAFEVELVDLAWPASDDRAEGFETLKLALTRVDECRPYFIGLLGQRYGPSFEKIPEDALAAFPWLAHVEAGASRMHLEIRHALLNDPTAAAKCLFYRRRAQCLTAAPPERQSIYRCETFQQAERLERLVKDIQATGRPVREYDCKWDVQKSKLADFDDLGRLITDDLVAAIAEQEIEAFEASLKGDAEQVDRSFSIAEPRASAEKLMAALADILGRSVSGADCVAAPIPHVPAIPEQQAQAEPKSVIVDENVQFTVYRPKAVQPDKWYALLAFAHLAEKRPNEAPDAADPLEEVRSRAKSVLGAKAADYQNVTQDSTRAVPQQQELTFVPVAADIEFNPKQRTFTWLESVHQEEFRMKASAKLDGATVRGKLSVFLGAILIADVPWMIRVERQQRSAEDSKPTQAAHARPYRKIFASYSHKDSEIVEQFEEYARTLGDEYLRDWKHLRAGEVWNDKLKGMIDEADIFQLFWSTNSMWSSFVRQEWEYALSTGKDNFVRPTYWQQPMPTSKDPELPPPELARLHFQNLSAKAKWSATTSSDAPRSEESTMQPEHIRDFGFFCLVSCPTCQHRFTMPMSEVGKRTTCPNCVTIFLVGTSTAGTQASEDPSTPTIVPSRSRPGGSQQFAEQLIKYNCPSCKKGLESPANEAATKKNCPNCGQRLLVPAAPSFGTGASQFVNYNCPRCKAPLQSPLTEVWTNKPCPKCGQRLQVPGRPESTQSSLNKTMLAADEGDLRSVTKYECPACHESLLSPRSEAGVKKRCPKCGVEFQVPGSHQLLSAQATGRLPAPLDPKPATRVRRVVYLLIALLLLLGLTTAVIYFFFNQDDPMIR